MAARLFNLLLCALLPGLSSPAAKAITSPENRVGGSAVFSSDFASQESANPICTRAENPGCGYDFVSGVHKYLYAQMGWINQYFQVVELADDERPLVQNTYNKEVKCSPAAPLSTKPEEKILEKGWISVNYKGIRWVFIPDSTLDPAVNKCYPEINIKGGRIFRKPSQDREFIRTGEQDAQLFSANEEEHAMKTVYSAYINSARAIYVARFDYTQV
ncbi:MAG: hypothetical protein ABSE16_04620 [Verrucomicrobiota bacterium]